MPLDGLLTIKKKKKKMSGEKPPSLIKIIEDFAVKEMQPRRGWFRPSMLFGCVRANIFHYTMAPEDNPQIPPQLRRVLDVGTKTHELIQDVYLSEHPDWWFVKEPAVQKKVCGVWIQGHSDGVMIRRSDRFRFGIEIKTIGHTEFMRLSKPKEEHVHQARIYMELQELPWIWILYWDKDKQHMKEYLVKRNPKAWEDVKDELKYLRKFVEKKTLPKYDRRACNLTFCKYVRHCRKNGAPV